MNLSGDELVWKQVKRRLYQASTSRGTYYINARTGNYKFKSELSFYVTEPVLFYPRRIAFTAIGRIRFLMAIAEIDAVTRAAH